MQVSATLDTVTKKKFQELRDKQMEEAPWSQPTAADTLRYAIHKAVEAVSSASTVVRMDVVGHEGVSTLLDDRPVPTFDTVTNEVREADASGV